MMKTYDRLVDYKRLFFHFWIDRLGSNHPNFPLPLALSCMFFSFFVYHCHMILSKRRHSSILTILLVKILLILRFLRSFPDQNKNVITYDIQRYYNARFQFLLLQYIHLFLMSLPHYLYIFLFFLFVHRVHRYGCNLTMRSMRPRLFFIQIQSQIIEIL